MNRLLFLAILFLTSCATIKIIPLKGTYPVTPMVFNSDKSFDKVWDNLVDVFAQKGLSIRIIDRSSGLIVSQKSSLKATIESKSGLYDSSAYVVVPYYIVTRRRVPVTNSAPGAYSTKTEIVANPVYGDWNVRIKTNPNGGATINVNITDLNYQTFYNKIKGTENNTVTIFDYKSTGVFEKQLADLIK